MENSTRPLPIVNEFGGVGAFRPSGAKGRGARPSKPVIVPDPRGTASKVQQVIARADLTFAEQAIPDAPPPTIQAAGRVTDSGDHPTAPTEKKS